MFHWDFCGPDSSKGTDSTGKWGVILAQLDCYVNSTWFAAIPEPVLFQQESAALIFSLRPLPMPFPEEWVEASKKEYYEWFDAYQKGLPPWGRCILLFLAILNT